MFCRTCCKHFAAQRHADAAGLRRRLLAMLARSDLCQIFADDIDMPRRRTIMGCSPTDRASIFSRSSPRYRGADLLRPRLSAARAIASAAFADTRAVGDFIKSVLGRVKSRRCFAGHAGFAQIASLATLFCGYAAAARRAADAGVVYRVASQSLLLPGRRSECASICCLMSWFAHSADHRYGASILYRRG